jgi:hypothetical protein
MSRDLGFWTTVNQDSKYSEYLSEGKTSIDLYGLNQATRLFIDLQVAIIFWIAYNSPERHLRFPEPRLRRYRKSSRASLGSRMGCVSKDASCSESYICFRFELLLEPEPTRHTGADSYTANEKPMAASCEF